MRGRRSRGRVGGVWSRMHPDGSGLRMGSATRAPSRSSPSWCWCRASSPSSVWRAPCIGGEPAIIVRTLKAAAPGPAGSVLTEAVDQAHRAGASHRYLALMIGLVGALISGTTLMGQIERGLNRIYGIERDRPTLRKYGRALLLAVSAGLLVAAAFTAIAFGGQIARSLDSDLAVRVWTAVRWPVAILLLAVAITAMFRLCPRRHQPGWTWLAFGATISVGLWVIVTALLAQFFNASSTFGQTYGPLAGIVALILWALASSIAVLFGGAIAAQLEAVRAGGSSPRNDRTDADTGSRVAVGQPAA